MAITKQSAGHVQATLDVGDVQIGAVELKNATDDTRVKIDATGSIAEGDNAVAMQAPVLGATTGAAVITDAAGTLQQYLRGLIRWAFERMPATLGQGTMAQSLPVALASDQASVPVAATATIADGADVAEGTTTDAAASSAVAEDATARTGIGLWKGIKNILILMNAKFAALGQATMANSMPVTLASDQTDVPALTFGALTAAAMGNGSVATIVAANANRRGLILTNVSDTIGYLSIGDGTGLTTTNYLFRIGTGETLEFSPPISQQAISAADISAAGKNIVYQEAT